MKRKIVLTLLIVTFLLIGVGCGKTETVDSQYKVQNNNRKNPLTDWYDQNQIESKCEFISLSINYDKEVEYTSASDSFQQKGFAGEHIFLLKDPTMKKEEVYKIAQFFFFKQMDDHQNVVEWTVEVKGKVKYKVALRYADKNRKSVALYEIQKGELSSAPFDIIDYQAQIGEDSIKTGDIRYCLDQEDSVVEKHRHPQLQKQIKGIVYQSRIHLFTNLDEEEQTKIVTSIVQNYVDNEIKIDEDTKATFIGIRAIVFVFGQEYPKKLFYMLDKDKDKMLMVDEESDGGV